MPSMLKTMICAAFGFAATALPANASSLEVVDSRFRLVTASGAVLSSDELVGAIFEIRDPGGALMSVRIDGVASAEERPGVLLHQFSVLDPSAGTWRPLCQPDAYGRRAGFPVQGVWDGHGGYVKDPDTWFLTCTSGAQGKCVLWGYDPWATGPHGEDLAPFYQACQHMVRADYVGDGVAHTRDGTPIDLWDTAGVQKPSGVGDRTFRFESGWTPEGAVCVARTRWEDLLPRDDLRWTRPDLVDPSCDEQKARAGGALLFNRSR